MAQISRKLDGREVLVTLDVDWAPDWMIEVVAERLRKVGVRATWFATHDSAAIHALERDPNFEIGIHPNLLAGSSQGSEPGEVFAALRSWYPNATTCRTHSLVQSEPLLTRMAKEFGIRVDCSIHLPRAVGVAPHTLEVSEEGHSIIRLPHIFQDNMHVISRRPWTLESTGMTNKGWKVLNFHPIHILLNSDSLKMYGELKEFGSIQSLESETIKINYCNKFGTGTFFDFIISEISRTETYTVNERINIWVKEKEEKCAS